MIYLPPPQPVLNKDIRISGDVEIHPTASLAPGVILQAAPDNRIVIGADVCIGMGVIINATQDSVEINSGAIIGSGVLIIGGCKIGNNACIGTAVTIFQTDVDAMTVIEPGSVLGDASRKVNLEKQPQKNKTNNSSTPKQTKKTKQSKVGSNGFYSAKSKNNQAQTEESDREASSSIPSSPPKVPSVEVGASPPAKSNKEPVVGQVYINQLLVTLFPHSPDFDSKVKKLQ